MKLLLDENISFRLVNKLTNEFPGISHVKFHNLINTDDKVVREFALQNEYTIVTNDSDFNDLLLIYGFPPKIIWMKTGNTSTDNNANMLILNKVRVLDFMNDIENGIMIIEK
jgi:predicted nuclease of predicted toxin-antitoxin system